MLCFVDKETEPSLVALYDIQPRNELGLFYSFTTSRAHIRSCHIPAHPVPPLYSEALWSPLSQQPIRRWLTVETARSQPISSQDSLWPHPPAATGTALWLKFTRLFHLVTSCNGNDVHSPTASVFTAISEFVSNGTSSALFTAPVSAAILLDR